MVKELERQKRIIFIEKSPFLRTAVELSLKSKAVEVYTVETLENNFYLLDDLKPNLILFDVQSVGESLSRLSLYASKASLVAIGEEGDYERVKSIVVSFMTKPLKASSLAESLLALVDYPSQ